MSSTWKSGFDEFSRKLHDVASSDSVPFPEMFPAEFMAARTQYSNFDEFLTGGGFDVKSQADFESIDAGKLDEHVRAKTSFTSWSEMLTTAYGEWAKRKLEA